MTRISSYHRRNLRKLSKFLRTLPKEYRRFRMSSFQRDPSKEYAFLVYPMDKLDVVHACGASACAIGWGPTAGIRPMKKDSSWYEYAQRVFGDSNLGSGYGRYIFGTENPNCPHEAADRIDHVLTGEYP